MSVYRPEKYEGPIAIDSTIGAKFSQKTFLHRSFLDQWKIPYVEEDLVEGFTGMGIYLDRDVEDNQKRCAYEKRL